ncbi:MAG TPA: transketolase C-terminal domain-containing protein, partial [Acidimicrobiales bacterium]|nr:transketolase C-terminal domain-containing protein [Acidimicrobiales bacterium]
IAMAGLQGVSYLRTTRGAYPVLYRPDESFPIGGAKVLKSSGADEVCLVGAGVTVHECLTAAERLGARGIASRVVDAYSIKPMDGATVLEASETTSGRFVVVEDHRPEGGLGAALRGVLSAGGASSTEVAHLAVRKLPMSGTSAELLDFEGISAVHIEEAARALVGGGR